MARTWCSLSSLYYAHVYGIWDMAEELEALGDVEFEGDPDLMIASRDFERIADARTNTGYLEGIEAGKQQGLEEGFHHGFVKGIQHAVHWAVLCGKISALQAHCSKFSKEQDPQYGQVSIQLSELLEVVKDREKKSTEKKLGEETQAFQMKCSQLVHQAKAQEAKETAASSDSSITLTELISRELFSYQDDQIQELYRKLEQLKSQLRLPK